MTNRNVPHEFPEGNGPEVEELKPNAPGARDGVIVRRFNGTPIAQRGDGYLNATAMCKAAGSEWKAYNRLDSTAAFLEELAGSVKISTDLLVQSITTGPNTSRGTWVHPQVAYHLAQWCSPAFAVQVTEWIHDIRTQGYATAPGIQTGSPITPEMIGGIVKAVLVKQVPALAEQVARQMLAEQLPAMVAAAIAADPRRQAIPNVTALEIAIAEGVSARKRRGLVNSISARLRRYCQAWEIWPAPDGRGVWTFPRQVVGPWLDHEGRALIAAHMAAVSGQTVLPFLARPKPAAESRPGA